jgi:hypothetical protein
VGSVRTRCFSATTSVRRHGVGAWSDERGGFSGARRSGCRIRERWGWHGGPEIMVNRDKRPHRARTRSGASGHQDQANAGFRAIATWSACCCLKGMRVARGLLLAVVSSSACTESAAFHGTGTYVVSPQGGPSSASVLEQSGLVCAGMGKVILRLDDQCVLRAVPTATNYATVSPSQSCSLVAEGQRRQLRVRGGTLFVGDRKGVRVTLDAELANAPQTTAVLEFSAPAPRLGVEGCAALL